ncbi:hypothetical protein ACXYMO_10660 [Arenibacterium sp. CAU 1754]
MSLSKGMARFTKIFFENCEKYMRNYILKFRRDEDGAVTVDWVVLTAAVVALAGAAFSSIQTASGGVGNDVGDYLSSKTITD